MPKDEMPEKRKQRRVSDASPALFSLQDEIDQQEFRDSVKEIGVDEYVRRLGELYEKMFPESESDAGGDKPES